MLFNVIETGSEGEMESRISPRDAFPGKSKKEADCREVGSTVVEKWKSPHIAAHRVGQTFPLRCQLDKQCMV